MDKQLAGSDRPRVSPADVFLHLGIIVTLYISSISLASLLFQVINKAFPDALNRYMTYSKDAVLWATAFLVIMFPLYLFLGWIYRKQLGADPEKARLAVRKWLVYLTLFLAGLALAIDLVTLVFYFLNGEITARFVLKVLAVLVIAGLVFGYYLADVRAGGMSRSRFKAYAWIACVLVVGSIIASFAVIGTPANQRKLRFDQTKVSDLQSIQSQVIFYWQQKERLPASLEAMQDPISSYMLPSDPQTGEAYDYAVTGPLSFKLCATFNMATREDDALRSPSYIYPYSPGDTNWKHEAGYACFERTIDPDVYPPRPNTTIKR